MFRLAAAAGGFSLDSTPGRDALSCDRSGAPPAGLAVLKAERGQVLVIFAGGLIALLAIAAVVIDLGFVFMIHRHEQNAADPGALAAARYIRYPGPGADTNKMFNAACFYARQNGYFARATDNSNSAAGC